MLKKYNLELIFLGLSVEDVEVDENSSIHDETTNNREDDSIHLFDLISMQEDQRNSKAGNKEEGSEEVARVLPAAVPVTPDVPTVAHAAEDVGHRHKDVGDDRDEGVPVLGDGTGKDVKKEAECDETGKRNDTKIKINDIIICCYYYCSFFYIITFLRPILLV